MTSVDASSAVNYVSVEMPVLSEADKVAIGADKVDDDAPHVLLPAVRDASFGKEVETGLDVRTASQ